MKQSKVYVFEKNHSIKNKNIYISSFYFKAVGRIKDYKTGVFDINVFSGEKVKIIIENDSFKMIPLYDFRGIEYIPFLPALFISDIEYIKKSASVNILNDSTYNVKTDRLDILMYSPKKIGGYMFFTNFRIKSKDMFFPVNIVLDSIK